MDFGFWVLDFGFWVLDFGFWVLDFGFWVLGFGFWILGFGFWILDFGFWILDFGFWILNFGFWILDSGVWGLAICFLATRKSSGLGRGTIREPEAVVQRTFLKRNSHFFRASSFLHSLFAFLFIYSQTITWIIS